MEYSDTLRQGWAITWKHKFLWLLASLPALAGLISLVISFATTLWMTNAAALNPEVLTNTTRSVILVSCLNILIVIIFSVVGVATRAGMITGVAHIVRGETTGLGPAFREGLGKLPSLLGMTILLAVALLIVVFGLFAVCVLPVLFVTARASEGQVGSSGFGQFAAICCIGLLWLLIAIIVNLIFTFATRGIMLNGEGALTSIGHGYRVSRENLVEIILLALPFVLVYGVIGGIFTVANFLGGFQLAIAEAGTAGITDTNFWGFLIAYLVYALTLIVLGTWQSATFTIGYLQWTRDDQDDLFNFDKLAPTLRP